MAADFSSPVFRIFDSNTIEVLHNQHPGRIHLSGIAYPEKSQAYGKRAKQTVSELWFGKEVILQTYGNHKYEGTLADMFLPDGIKVNYTLVQEAGRMKHVW